jgi:hypothetical protein
MSKETEMMGAKRETVIGQVVKVSTVLLSIKLHHTSRLMRITPVQGRRTHPCDTTAFPGISPKSQTYLASSPSEATTNHRGRRDRWHPERSAFQITSFPLPDFDGARCPVLGGQSHISNLQSSESRAIGTEHHPLPRLHPSESGLYPS